MADAGAIIVTPESQVEALFTPERARLVRLMESNLFCLAKEIENEAQARVVRELFQRPLGVLNARFGLRSNAAHVRK